MQGVESLKRCIDTLGADHTKRARVDAPSKVVFIRNLPLDVQDNEVFALVTAFGPIVRSFSIKQKGQCFIQFESETPAISCVNYYAASPTHVRGRPVYAEFSPRQEITDPNAVAGDGGAGSGGCVLLVQVSAQVYPVTLDAVQALFAKVLPPGGALRRIVTFTKPQGSSALVEVDSPASAAAAMGGLNGHNMYPGCNLLTVQYSKLPAVAVKRNDERSWDFTLDPRGPPTGLPPPPPIAAAAPPPPPAFPGYSPLPASSPYMPLGGVGHGGMPGYPAAATAAFPPAYPAAAGAAAAGMYGLPMGGLGGGGGSAVVVVFGIAPTAEEVAAAAATGGVLAPGLTPDQVFLLFGLYGDVERVKIMYNRQDSALVQYSDGAGAARGVEMLNGVQLRGRQLRVSLSKHAVVQLPRPTDQESGLTRDYAGSPLHRFKGSTKHLKNLFPPGPVLHVSNIGEGVGEAGLRELFAAAAGMQPLSIKILEDGSRRMALVDVGSTPVALDALLATHNAPLPANPMPGQMQRHIRVSFSRGTSAGGAMPPSAIGGGGGPMAGGPGAGAAAMAASAYYHAVAGGAGGVPPM